MGAAGAATSSGRGSGAAVMSSSARVFDTGAEGADPALPPRPLSAVPPEEASPTRQSPPGEPPSSVLAGSAAMSPPQPASPVLAAATPEVRSPAASPDPAPLPPPPPQHLPPPPPPQHPPPAPAAPAAAPINPSAESRSSRVQALLRRTAQLTEVASARSSAPMSFSSQLMKWQYEIETVRMISEISHNTLRPIVKWLISEISPQCHFN